MTVHCEPDHGYQHTAIEAVCGRFRGQESCGTEFTGQSMKHEGLVGGRLRVLGEDDDRQAFTGAFTWGRNDPTQRGPTLRPDTPWTGGRHGDEGCVGSRGRVPERRCRTMASRP